MAGTITLYGENFEQAWPGTYAWRLRYYDEGVDEWSAWLPAVGIDQPLVWQARVLTHMWLYIGLKSYTHTAFHAGPFDFLAGKVYMIDLVTLEPPEERAFPWKWIGIGTAAFIGGFLIAQAFKK